MSTTPEPLPDAIPTTSHSWETRRLIFDKQKEVYRKRLTRSFIFALIATAIALSLAFFELRSEVANSNSRLDYYNTLGFEEWRSNAIPPEADFWGEIQLALNGLYSSLNQVFFGNRDSIAGMARAYGIILSSIALFICYRLHLHERLQLEGKYAQADDFADMKQQFWIFLGTRVLYFISSLFGGYIFLSVCFQVFSLGFPTLQLDYAWAVVAIGVLAGLITGFAVYLATTVTSRTLLLLGIGTWVGGLFLAFILNAAVHTNPFWWCGAVSDAGRSMPSAPVFSAAFLCAVLAIWALWFDIDSLIERFIPFAIREMKKPGDEVWYLKPFKPIRELMLRIVPPIFKDYPIIAIRILYFVALVGLLGVGFVRTNENNVFNNFIHTGGVGIAIVCIVILTVLVPKRFFSPYYGTFSYSYVAVLILLGIGYAFVPGAGCDGRFITLTTLELFSILFVVVWTYVTVDNLFHYSNAHWDKLRADEIAAAEAAKNEKPNPNDKQ